MRPVGSGWWGTRVVVWVQYGYSGMGTVPVWVWQIASITGNWPQITGNWPQIAVIGLIWPQLEVNWPHLASIRGKIASIDHK